MVCLNKIYQLSPQGIVQGSGERWTPGCVNATGKVRQKYTAIVGTKFNKPGTCLSAELCISTCMAAMATNRDHISSNCQFGKEWRSMVKAGLREFKALIHCQK